MESIITLYKIGHGPSSSHTMGPANAAKYFKNVYHNADQFKVTLYGSLALTGRGHLTDKTILETLAPIKTDIV
jgi:L-serine dehydratase